ncbi:MAG: hypothetical protein V4649_00295 [Bacteroidota bacterium]
MRKLILIALLLKVTVLFGQINYHGTIGKFPVELITDVYSDGDARAIYSYKNFDEPIEINGRLVGTELTLFERGKKGDSVAILQFASYSKISKSLSVPGRS